MPPQLRQEICGGKASNFEPQAVHSRNAIFNQSLQL
jgi:hypothetical protein